MARYRMYKNGIYGHRYKGYYIVKADNGLFDVIDGERVALASGLPAYDDGEWEIDKATASEADLKVMDALYRMEIYQLSSLFVDLMQKSGRGRLSDKDQLLYNWVEKVRKRKAEGKPFDKTEN